MNTCSNEKVTFAVKTQGAELCSLRDSNGTEYLWQANPNIWGRHAPLLFPIVGSLRNNQYTHGGQTYTLPQHGFARNMDFTLIEEQADSLVYQLLPNEKTRPSYPFEFDLRVQYRLLDDGVAVKYEVLNRGEERMPFSIGAHPGFNLPLGPDDRIEDCYLLLEKEETLDSRIISDQGYLESGSFRAVDHSNRIPLTANLFDHDALFFMEFDFDRLTLCSTKNTRRITVEFPDFQQLAIWSKPGAPFVCIEPWYGYLDPEHPYGDLTHKPGIQHLNSGDSFCCEHRIFIAQ